MTAALGREVLLTDGTTPLAAIRTKSMNFSGESVDITTGDSNGFRYLLEASGQQQIDIPIEGILDDHVLQDLALGGGELIFPSLTMTWPIANPANNTEATLVGPFRLSSLEQSMAYNDAINFSGTLESAGEWVYTAETTTP